MKNEILIVVLLLFVGCTSRAEQTKPKPVTPTKTTPLEKAEPEKNVAEKATASSTPDAQEKGQIDPYRQSGTPAHLVCDTGSDCLIVAGECGLNRLGNKAKRKSMESKFAVYAKEIRADKTRECPETKLIPRSTGCLENRCLTWPYEPNKFAKKACSSATDCAVVEGICGQFEVVHATNADEATKVFAKANSMKDCAVATDPKPKARCDHNVCVPELTRPMLDRLHPNGKGKPLPKTF